MPKVRRTYWLFPDLNVASRNRRRLRPWPSRYELQAQSQIDRMYKVKKDQANLVSSNVPGKEGVHAPVLDLDLPAKLVPSSTPGHHHLYIDIEVEQDKYWNLLDALADCGIIERGYANASKRKGGTFVRVPGVIKPWVKKKEEETTIREAPTMDESVVSESLLPTRATINVRRESLSNLIAAEQRRELVDA